MGQNGFREDGPLLVLIGPHPPHDSHGKLLLVSLAQLPLGGLSPERFRPMRSFEDCVESRRHPRIRPRRYKRERPGSGASVLLMRMPRAGIVILQLGR